MNPEYIIELLMDNTYQVFSKDDESREYVLFQGTLPEVSAWIDLQVKGYF